MQERRKSLVSSWILFNLSICVGWRNNWPKIFFINHLCREDQGGRYQGPSTISAYNNLYGLNGSVRHVLISFTHNFDYIALIKNRPTWRQSPPSTIDNKKVRRFFDDTGFAKFSKYLFTEFLLYYAVVLYIKLIFKMRYTVLCRNKLVNCLLFFCIHCTICKHSPCITDNGENFRFIKAQCSSH